VGFGADGPEGVVDGRDRAVKPPTRQLSPTLVVRWAAPEATVSSLMSLSEIETSPLTVTVQAAPTGMATEPSIFTDVPSAFTTLLSMSL
jgi:hypothetical protein